jgi:hypothetical protein
MIEKYEEWFNRSETFIDKKVRDICNEMNDSGCKTRYSILLKD